jgi:peptide/nickel transport system permease protein
MLTFLIRKLFAVAATLVFVTASLYAMAMVTPADVRVTLYMPSTNSARKTEEQIQRTIDLMIDRYGLNDPYLVQYGRWLGSLLRGELGFSPSAHSFVADALITRIPATVELILYSLLLFIPLGIVTGMIAGSQKGRGPDWLVRLSAYLAASLPPFILALVLLSIFWVGLKWFSIGRLEVANTLTVRSADFRLYTGLLTIDGLLNGRPDISRDALRHLVLPVITISLFHLSTLARITRAAAIEELDKDYIQVARGKGLEETTIVWRHALPNVILPALNSSALSVASLVTSLFVVETIFLFNGVSSLVVNAFSEVPDISLALGFVLFSVIVVLAVMTILDILQALLDPLVRQGESLL